MLIHSIDELCAMLNHLIHSHLLQEFSILVAVLTIILIFTPIGICTENFLCKRHSATLTKFLFHIIIFLYVSMLQKHTYLTSYSNIWDKLASISDEWHEKFS